MERSNVLVTGGLGNIGESAIRSLLERGDRVCAFDLERPVTRRVAKRFGDRIELRWGDVRSSSTLAAAMYGKDAIVHLAAVLPPEANDEPDLAASVNIGGTEALLSAASLSTPPPRVLLASSFAVFGPTQHLPPPRRAGDPVVATDGYSGHKIWGEAALADSGLEWCVLRFCDVPPMAMRSPHPMLFDIPLDTRFETLHTEDAGFAIAEALHRSDVWRRTLLVGGGRRCQMSYRDYLFTLLDIIGVGPLPEEAFSRTPHYGDWLDTHESESLLRYQRHSFQDIATALARALSSRSRLIRAFRPVARWYLLRLSGHYRFSKA